MSFKYNSRRMRFMYSKMTVAERDMFLDSVTNEFIISAIKKIKDIRSLTLFTEDEYISHVVSTSTRMKQHRLKRFLETGRLKSYEEDDILPVTTIQAIHDLMMSKYSNILENDSPELLV